MIKLTEGMTLYHGSYVEVSKPDLDKCALYKDFGKGFYLTTSKEQALSFAKLSTSKAKFNKVVPMSQDYGIVSTFIVKNIDDYLIKVYESANVEWLHCVVGHRKKHTFDDCVKQLIHYDVIAGKIANDSTNTTINAYMTNTFGAVGSNRADAICIELLLPNRLQDQFCFRSKKVLECLEFKGSEKVWMKE